LIQLSPAFIPIVRMIVFKQECNLSDLSIEAAHLSYMNQNVLF